MTPEEEACMFAAKITMRRLAVKYADDPALLRDVKLCMGKIMEQVDRQGGGLVELSAIVMDVVSERARWNEVGSTVVATMDEAEALRGQLFIRYKASRN